MIKDSSCFLLTETGHSRTQWREHGAFRFVDWHVRYGRIVAYCNVYNIKLDTSNNQFIAVNGDGERLSFPTKFVF